MIDGKCLFLTIERFGEIGVLGVFYTRVTPVNFVHVILAKRGLGNFGVLGFCGFGYTRVTFMYSIHVRQVSQFLLNKHHSLLNERHVTFARNHREKEGHVLFYTACMLLRNLHVLLSML